MQGQCNCKISKFSLGRIQSNVFVPLLLKNQHHTNSKAQHHHHHPQPQCHHQDEFHIYHLTCLPYSFQYPPLCPEGSQHSARSPSATYLTHQQSLAQNCLHRHCACWKGEWMDTMLFHKYTSVHLESVLSWPELIYCGISAKTSSIKGFLTQVQN